MEEEGGELGVLGNESSVCRSRRAERWISWRGVETDEFLFLLAIATAVVRVISVEDVYPVVVFFVANSDRIEVLRGRFP